MTRGKKAEQLVEPDDGEASTVGDQQRAAVASNPDKLE